MITMQQQIDALLRFCIAGSEGDRQAAQRKLRAMVASGQCQRQDPQTLLRGLLVKMGAPDHLRGHSYLVEAVLLCLEDESYIHNVTFGLYPCIAAKFDTSANRVERAIRNLVEVTWTRGDYELLEELFGNTVSARKYKPTNAVFIARLANVLRQELNCAV